MESSEEVFFGFEGSFSVTITNNGPEIAEMPSTISPLMSLANDDFYLSIDSSIIQNDCSFAFFSLEPRPPDFAGGTIILIDTSPIDVGESITCFGRYVVGFENGMRELLWETVNFGQGTLIDDPIPENNLVTITLGIQPQQVDALSSLTIFILIVLTLGVGLRHRF